MKHYHPHHYQVRMIPCFNQWLVVTLPEMLGIHSTLKADLELYSHLSKLW